MDTSMEYIKMCKKAEEIQDTKWLSAKGREYPWEEGDLFSLKNNVQMYDSCSHSEGFIEPDIYNTSCIWLPSQEQLQDMVIIEYKHFYALLDVFHMWSIQPTLDRNLIESMEQLWLAFVMKEKYNKVWNGEDWGK